MNKNDWPEAWNEQPGMSPREIIEGSMVPRKTAPFSWRAILPLALVVLVIIMVIRLFSSFLTPSPAAQAEVQQLLKTARIIRLSETIVATRLRSPGTAQFAGAVAGRDHYKIFKLPNGNWQVFSWVDSQNGFGAICRPQEPVRNVVVEQIR